MPGIPDFMTAKMCVARSCIYYTLYFIVSPINQQVKFRGDIIPTALIRLNKSIDLEKIFKVYVHCKMF